MEPRVLSMNTSMIGTVMWSVKLKLRKETRLRSISPEINLTMTMATTLRRCVTAAYVLSFSTAEFLWWDYLVCFALFFSWIWFCELLVLPTYFWVCCFTREIHLCNVCIYVIYVLHGGTRFFACPIEREVPFSIDLRQASPQLYQCLRSYADRIEHERSLIVHTWSVFVFVCCLAPLVILLLHCVRCWLILYRFI